MVLIESAGFHIEVEGTDGTGKTTLVNRLLSDLAPNYPTKVLPEFSNSELGEMFRGVIHKKQFISLGQGNSRAETLALIADHHLKLQEGFRDATPMIRILDRGILSILAYQSLRLEATEKREIGLGIFCTF